VVAKEEVVQRWNSLDVERRQEVLRFTDAGMVARMASALQSLYMKKLHTGSTEAAQNLFGELSLMNRAFVMRGKQGKDAATVDVMEVSRDFAAQDIDDFLREFENVLPDFLGRSRRVIPAACWATRLWSQPSSFKAFQEQLAKTVEQALWAMALDPLYAPTPVVDDDWIQEVAKQPKSKAKKGSKASVKWHSTPEDGSGEDSEPSAFDDIQDDAQATGEVVIKMGFIEFDEGPGLRHKFLKQKGKAKTDSFLEISENSAIVDAQQYVPPVLDEVTEDSVDEGDESSSSNACLADEVSSGTETDTSSGEPGKTTVMLRNLPNNYSRDMLLGLLDAQGFGGLYDFIYLPMDFSKQSNLGYAFVNLVTPQLALKLWKSMADFSNWSIPSAKICQVSWSQPIQGLEANIKRYQNSPVMHESVPPEYQPLLFLNGVPQAMPPPTRKIKFPFQSRQQKAKRA